MGEVYIGVGSTMKYLGFVVDSRWNVVEHFRRLTPRPEWAGAAYRRLLPNLGGPIIDFRVSIVYTGLFGFHYIR